MDKEQIATIATAAVKLRDTGAQDWTAFIRLEVLNACPDCQAALEAIRTLVETTKLPEYDPTVLVADKSITYLEMAGSIVKYKTDEGWCVGTVKKASTEIGEVG